MREHLRDPLNGLISFLGFWLTVVGVGWMFIQVQDQPLKMWAIAIYGAGLGLTFLASALHHWVKAKPETELLLLQIDHAAIYLAIAGTYTPVCLFLLEGTARWVMLGGVWLIAVLGFVQKFAFFKVPDSVDDPPDRLSTAIYAVMGALALFQIGPLYEAAGAEGLAWAVAGGLFYLVGAYILTSRKLDSLPGSFGHHEVWHLCVVAGSVCLYGFLFQTVLYR